MGPLLPFGPKGESGSMRLDSSTSSGTSPHTLDQVRLFVDGETYSSKPSSEVCILRQIQLSKEQP